MRLNRFKANDIIKKAKKHTPPQLVKLPGVDIPKFDLYGLADIPQIPEPSERETHLRRLNELVANFEKDEAEVAIEALIGRYPDIIYKIIGDYVKDLERDRELIASYINKGERGQL